MQARLWDSLSLTLSLITISITSHAHAGAPATPVTTTAAGEPGIYYSEENLYALAPYAIQIVNLAIFDPNLAASLVPDEWIGLLTESALALEAEVATPLAKVEPASPWPIGPWSSPESLAASINALQPRAVGSLYKALRPRFALDCRRRKTAPEACERAIKTSIARLSSPEVLARTAAQSARLLTPTQQELARLGRPVVLAVRGGLQRLDGEIWGVRE